MKQLVKSVFLLIAMLLPTAGHCQICIDEDLRKLDLAVEQRGKYEQAKQKEIDHHKLAEGNCITTMDRYNFHESLYRLEPQVESRLCRRPRKTMPGDCLCQQPALLHADNLQLPAENAPRLLHPREGLRRDSGKHVFVKFCGCFLFLLLFLFQP